MYLHAIIYKEIIILKFLFSNYSQVSSFPNEIVHSELMVIINRSIYFIKQLPSRLDDERMATPLNIWVTLTQVGLLTSDEQN